MWQADSARIIEMNKKVGVNYSTPTFDFDYALNLLSLLESCDFLLDAVFL